MEIDLDAPLRPVRFLVPELIPLGYLSFLAAREGAGKTTLLAGLAWQMARPAGRGRFLGRPVEHGATIYLNTDAPDGEGRSVRHWLERHQAAYPDGDKRLVRVLEPKGTGLAPADLADVGTMALDLGALLIVVDSFMGSFSGVDATRLELAMGPLQALRDLATRTGAGVTAVDHLPKKMPGERDGDRGVFGSVAKQAQARSVHLLSRLEPKDVGGRDVMRWAVTKQSFGPRLEPFGVEVRLEGDPAGGEPERVKLQVCDLPGEDSGLERAERAVARFLEARAGEEFPRAELLEVATTGGNIRSRQAEEALGRALGGFGARLEVLTYPGRGSPKGYRLKPAEQPAKKADPGDVVQECVKSESDAQDALLFPHTPIAGNGVTAGNGGAQTTPGAAPARTNGKKAGEAARTAVTNGKSAAPDPAPTPPEPDAGAL